MSLADLGNYMSSVILLLLACVSLQGKLCCHVFPFWEWTLDLQPGHSQLLLPETFSGVSIVLHVSSSFSLFPFRVDFDYHLTKLTTARKLLSITLSCLFCYLHALLFLCSAQTKSSIKSRSVFW